MKDYLAYILDKEFAVEPRIECEGSTYYLHFDDAETHSLILSNFQVVNGYFYAMGLAYQIIDPEEGDARTKQFKNKIIQIKETKSIGDQPLIFASVNAKQASADRILEFLGHRLDALYIDRDEYAAKAESKDLKALWNSVMALPKKFSVDDFDVSLELSVAAITASCKIAAKIPTGYLTVLYMKPERVFIRHKNANAVTFPKNVFWQSFVALFDTFFLAYGEDQPTVEVSFSTQQGQSLTALKKNFPEAKTYLKIKATIQYETINVTMVDDNIKVSGAQQHLSRVHDLSVGIYEFLRGMQNIRTVK